MKEKIYLIFLFIAMILSSCDSKSQKRVVDEPELMPPLELGKYEGPFHVTSRDVDVVNERGGGTPSVSLTSSGASFCLDCHSDFMVTKIEIRTENNIVEGYCLYSKNSIGRMNVCFDHQENDVYELKKLQQGLQCRIKRNKSSKPRWILLRLQIGPNFFPSIVIYQSGRE